ncbi:MAG: archease [Candidatus Diapherotrites archaeon]
MKYRFLEHTADIKFQAYGKNLEEVFENCGLALLKSIYSGKIKEIQKKEIKISGKDTENLLYNFLEEFLFLFDSKKFLVAKIKKLKIDEKKLKIQCTLIGDSSERYEIETSIKAVTYNEMFVKKEKGNWIAQVVLDV